MLLCEQRQLQPTETLHVVSRLQILREKCSSSVRDVALPQRLLGGHRLQAPRGALLLRKRFLLDLELVWKKLYRKESLAEERFLWAKQLCKCKMLQLKQRRLLSDI